MDQRERVAATVGVSLAPMLSVRRGADPFGHHWEIGKPLRAGVGE